MNRINRTLALLLALCLCLVPASALAQEDNTPPENGNAHEQTQPLPDDPTNADNEQSPADDEATPENGDNTQPDDDTQPLPVLQPVALPPGNTADVNRINLSESPLAPDPSAQWSMSGGVITLTGPGPFILFGTTTDITTAYTVQVTHTGTPVEVTLENAEIESGTASPFSLNPNVEVELWLEGDNTLKATGTGAGLRVPSTATRLTIGAPNTSSSLTATGNGAGIGGGVYGEASGAINIEGGTVIARGGAYAAGIGGGREGDGGDVEITGGVVTAQSSTYAAGIGGGSEGNQTGAVTISGSARVTATGGSSGAAGIGGGMGGNQTDTVTISGSAQVTAQGGANAAGIGGGVNMGYGGNGGDVEITGGTVIAQGGNNAAGIGGGNGGNPGALAITGGSVKRSGNSPSMESTARDSLNPTGTPLYLLTLTLDGAGDDVAVHNFTHSEMTAPYNADGALTMDGGRLYFWLPLLDEGDATLSIANNSYQGRAAVAANDDNIATLTIDPSVSSGTSSSGNGGSNVSTTAATIPITPAHQIWSGEEDGLTFTAAGVGPAAVLAVQVDGATLDAGQYTVREGSVVLQLPAAYLASLAHGEHTLRLVFWNGTGTATFEVRPTATTPPAPDIEVNSNPATGGPRGGGAAWAALLAAAGCLVCAGRYRR